MSRNKQYPLDAQWREALYLALREAPIPHLGDVAQPHEWYAAAVTARALKALRFKDSVAYDLARKYTGKPQQRLVAIFNSSDGPG